MNRRNFLITAAGLIGGMMLEPIMAKANRLILQNDFSLALEDWLLTTGRPDFGPTISVLLNGNSSVVYLPFISK